MTITMEDQLKGIFKGERFYAFQTSYCEHLSHALHLQLPKIHASLKEQLQISNSILIGIFSSMICVAAGIVELI